MATLAQELPSLRLVVNVRLEPSAERAWRWTHLFACPSGERLPKLSRATETLVLHRAWSESELKLDSGRAHLQTAVLVMYHDLAYSARRSDPTAKPVSDRGVGHDQDQEPKLPLAAGQRCFDLCCRHVALMETEGVSFPRPSIRISQEPMNVRYVVRRVAAESTEGRVQAHETRDA